MNSNTMIPISTRSVIAEVTPMSVVEILAWTHEIGEDPGYPTIVCLNPSLETYDLEQVESFLDHITLIARTLVKPAKKCEAVLIIERLAVDSEKHRIMLGTLTECAQHYKNYLKRGRIGEWMKWSSLLSE